MNELGIREVTSVEEYVAELSELLIAVVEDGASIGFLPPLSREDAEAYWAGVPDPNVRLFIAVIDNRIVGTVQLQLCGKANGRHRAEIAKLMAHPDYRRRGIGRALMQEAEKSAKQSGITTLVLDTRDGDPSNLLYASLGFVLAGSIPQYARSADGELHATNLYYKL
ncbi:GNAT family N-acetyltransferase [Cohnella sp. AR92]|uniref:GNAT family N-acetyltransferase n=1 Tax=Cohnella sp. AR92 TaxID=648716 RepID=UPI000F8C6470|nr:GNAT family N-acetyltransferase [Cohnella sp. AR92]RUS47319.1 GNAT family N-acetyltransferase [Cohnella sp. AR92]